MKINHSAYSTISFGGIIVQHIDKNMHILSDCVVQFPSVSHTDPMHISYVLKDYMIMMYLFPSTVCHVQFHIKFAALY